MRNTTESFINACYKPRKWGIMLGENLHVNLDSFFFTKEAIQFELTTTTHVTTDKQFAKLVCKIINKRGGVKVRVEEFY